MRKSSSARRLGWAVAGVAAAAFVALPAMAEPPSHGFNSRPPREPRPQTTTVVHAPHAPHKPPPDFAPLIQDQPSRQRTIIENLGAPKPAEITRVRSPHVQRGVRGIIKVPRAAHGRTVVNIVHVNKVETKKPVTLNGPRPKVPVQHPSKSKVSVD